MSSPYPITRKEDRLSFWGANLWFALLSKSSSSSRPLQFFWPTAGPGYTAKPASLIHISLLHKGSELTAFNQLQIYTTDHLFHLITTAAFQKQFPLVKINNDRLCFYTLLKCVKQSEGTKKKYPPFSELIYDIYANPIKVKPCFSMKWGFPTSCSPFYLRIPMTDTNGGNQLYY